MNKSPNYSQQLTWITLGLALIALGQIAVWSLHNPSLQGIGWVATVIGGVIAVISRTVFHALIPATTTHN